MKENTNDKMRTTRRQRIRKAENKTNVNFKKELNKEKRSNKIKNKGKESKNRDKKSKKREALLESKIQAYKKDENIIKVIRPKYNFVLKFFDELNMNVYILMFFAVLIALCGEKTELAVFIAILMFVTFILKAILDYKIFKYTIYLFYPNKIVRKNLMFKRDKTIEYNKLKDIRYGTSDNTFGSALLGLTNIVFIHEKNNIFKSNNISIPNQPNKEEYIQNLIIETVDAQYIQRILDKNSKKR